MTNDTEVKEIDRRQIDINPNSFSFILQIAHKNYLSCYSIQTELSIVRFKYFCT